MTLMKTSEVDRSILAVVRTEMCVQYFAAIVNVSVGSEHTVCTARCGSIIDVLELKEQGSSKW